MNRKIFRDPPRRAKPFWSLNGELKEEELKKQIAVMEQMGFGGAYLHARTGLKTEYLSPEWFRLMNLCADELSSRGMEAWLYDEDRYPSGVAGGLVTKNPAYRGKYLTVRFEEDGYRREEGDVAAFSVRFEGDRLRSYAKYEGQKGTVAVFSVRVRENQDVYNGYAYVDALKKEATEEFLRLTHEEYAKAMGERLGGSVKGIFTDEPNRGAIFNGFAHQGEDAERRAPYTEALFGAYYARWGERLEEKLPELYFRGDETFSRTAWRYTETLTELFLENYCVPYAEWCKEHGVAFTGHILHEDNLSAMTTLCGSPMRFYEHMDLPGVDNLTANSTNLAVPLMAYSVARQCKKKGVMCEMYAAIGWQADFMTYKRIGDWHAMFGVDDRCTHLSMYTMAGAAKRDYPASILQQADWWKDYSLVEDYFARLNYFLAQGKRKAELLYIHPVESAWGMSRMGGYRDFFTPKDEEYLALERRYFNVVNALARGGVAFDFGDEEMMSRLARVSARGGTPLLQVGAESYPAVLLAGNVTLRASVCRLLQKFLKAGGKVYVVGKFPRYREGEPFRAESVLKGAVLVEEEDLCGLFSLPFRTEGGFAYTRFSTENDKIYFTAINAEREKRAFTFAFRGEYAPERFDPRTGGSKLLSAEYREGETVISVELDQGEEILLLLLPGRSEAKPEAVCAAVRTPVPDEVSYSLKEPNVCVLDHAEYLCGGKEGRGEILRIDRVLREALSLPQRTPEAIQPWYRKKFLPRNETSAAAVLRYPFFVKKRPSAVCLVREPIEGETILFNGAELDLSLSRPSEKDGCFQVLPLPDALFKRGRNILEVVFRFCEETDVEAMYLTGNFGVEANGATVTLGALPKKIRFGDITSQGLPFYGGELRYRIPLGKGEYEVRLPSYAGALARVGKQRLPFKPFVARTKGNGSLEIAVTVTRRNTFGPLHYTGECFSSPGEFCPPNELFTENDLLTPQGLTEPPLLFKLET